MRLSSSAGLLTKTSKRTVSAQHYAAFTVVFPRTAHSPADIDDIAALDLLPPCASPEGEGRAAES